MAQAKALDRRRKSIRNIRKITRTMELIATARFKKAMDRATAATEYTKRITQLVADLATSGLTVSHPLLDEREHTGNSILLVLTANRGLCGGFNSGAVRQGQMRLSELREASDAVRIEVAGKRGISALKFRGITVDEGFTHFDDNVRYDDVDVLANRYLEDFAAGGAVHDLKVSLFGLRSSAYSPRPVRSVGKKRPPMVDSSWSRTGLKRRIRTGETESSNTPCPGMDKRTCTSPWVLMSLSNSGCRA